MMNLESKRFLVTGGSRGIGKAIVVALVEKGAKVAALATETDRVQALVDAYPDNVIAVGQDLLEVDDFSALATGAATKLGGIDGLVNCAGIIKREVVGAIQEASVTRQLGVNLIAPLLLSQAVADLLKASSKGGVIINVSSTLSKRPAPGTLVYSATKAALDSLTTSLALELAPHGIRVNAVLPGVVRTDMVAEMIENDDRLLRLHPLGRLGQPEDIARVVVQLIENDWQTGALVTVDGGLLSRS